jgi:hypothetical protein
MGLPAPWHCGAHTQDSRVVRADPDGWVASQPETLVNTLACPSFPVLWPGWKRGPWSRVAGAGLPLPSVTAGEPLSYQAVTPGGSQAIWGTSRLHPGPGGCCAPSP